MHQEAQLYLRELWKVSLKGCTEKERNIIYNTNKGYLGAHLPLHFLHFFFTISGALQSDPHVSDININ